MLKGGHKDDIKIGKKKTNMNEGLGDVLPTGLKRGLRWGKGPLSCTVGSSLLENVPT